MELVIIWLGLVSHRLISIIQKFRIKNDPRGMKKIRIAMWVKVYLVGPIIIMTLIIYSFYKETEIQAA